MTSRHLLFIPSWYPTASAPVSGVFFRDQARLLQQGGYRVGVVFAETRPWRQFGWRAFGSGLGATTLLDEEGVTTARSALLNVVSRRWRARRWVAETIRLAEVYASSHGYPDVLHAQSTLWAGTAALLLARRWRKPLVITEHSTAFLRGLVTPWERRWIREACALPTRTLAVGPALADALAAVAGGALPAVIPNVVEAEFFEAPTVDPTRTVDILCVALLEPKKGIDILLEAVAELHRHTPGLRVRVIGGGPALPSLLARRASLGLDHVVAFTGSCGRGEVRAAMRTARLFVLPSRVETFGLVLAEAMASGLPVVATRCGGPEAFVRPPFGWLVPPEDGSQLASAIGEALAASKRVGGAGPRAYALAEFGPDVFRARMEQVYAELTPHAPV